MRRFALLSALVVVLLSCSQEDFGEPIPVPEHPAFILRSVGGENTITVVDLDSEEVVGYRQVVKGQYVMHDFAVTENNLVFLPISWFKIAVDNGKCVLAVDVARDKPVVDSIPTSIAPCDIHPFAGGTKAFVAHNIMLWGDTDVVATEIDLLNPRMIDTFRFSGILENVLTFDDGGVYLLYSDWSAGPDDPDYMQKFDPSGDSLLGNDLIEVVGPWYIGEYAVVISDSIFAARGEGGIVFFKRDGSLVAEVALEDSPARCVACNGKLYVCHDNGELMKYGNFNKVSVIDLGSKAVVKTIEVCDGPCDIAYSAATNKIVVISGVGTVITIIDPETDSVTNTLVSDEVTDEDLWGYTRLRIPE